MSGAAIIIKIILITSIHFLLSILLVGSGILSLFRGKFPGQKLSPAGYFLLCIAAGMLYNTLQFAPVLSLPGKLSAHSHSLLAAGKYTMDAAFLVIVTLVSKKKFPGRLKELLRVFADRGNAALLIISLVIGMIAVLNFPHVHDSGQLSATNLMLRSGMNLLGGKRYAFAFSALLYFPGAIFKNIPLTTLASGFKLFLLLSTGLAAIYGMEKLSTINSTVSKFLYFFIIVTGYFGIYGMLELGKDSAWAVLFSLVFIFSLFRRAGERNYVEPLLYFLCAVLLGMIAIPYLCIFCVVYITVRLLPRKITGHKIIIPGAAILLLIFCFMLLPGKLALKSLPPFQSGADEKFYWYPYPTDGKTSFYSYFFSFDKNGYRNSTPLLIAGLLGILLLPMVKERFSDDAVKSAALFPLAAAGGCLFLAFLARDFLPAQRLDKIPFTPFTTFDAWNLVKDIPQWYVQIILGIFFIILLDALVKKIGAGGRAGRAVYMGAAIIALSVILSANFTKIISLKNPAYFYSYGGNKNKLYALVMENIYRNPSLRRIKIMKGSTTLDFKNFFWEIKSYFSWKDVGILTEIKPGEAPYLAAEMPFILISSRTALEKLSRSLAEYDTFFIYRLEYFNETDEGLYVVSWDKIKLNAAGSSVFFDVRKPGRRR